MLRLSVILERLAGKADVEALAECRARVVRVQGDLLEAWLWCRDARQLLDTLEALVEGGLVPTTLGLLDGRRVPVESLSLDPETLAEMGSRSIPVEGLVAVRYFTRRAPKILWELGLVKRIEPPKSIAYIQLSRRATTAELFDNMLRLVKPLPAPPGLD